MLPVLWPVMRASGNQSGIHIFLFHFSIFLFHFTFAQVKFNATMPCHDAMREVPGHVKDAFTFDLTFKNKCEYKIKMTLQSEKPMRTNESTFTNENAIHKMPAKTLLSLKVKVLLYYYCISSVTLL